MGLKPHEKPADVYSLGSLLLELTAGAPSDDPKSLDRQRHMRPTEALASVKF